MNSIPYPFKLLTFTLFLCTISACGVDPSASLTEGEGINPTETRSLERHMPMMICGDDSCSGGGFFPTPTPMPTPTATPVFTTAVQGLSYCVGVSCPTPAGFGLAGPGGSVYTSNEYSQEVLNKLFKKSGTVQLGESFVRNIGARTRSYAGNCVAMTPSIPVGFNALLGYSCFADRFYDISCSCFDIFAEVETFSNQHPLERVTDAYYCAKDDFDPVSCATAPVGAVYPAGGVAYLGPFLEVEHHLWMIKQTTP